MRDRLIYGFILCVVLLMSASILPVRWQWVSVDWPVLVLCYWAFLTPGPAFGVSVLIGLLLDTLYGSYLGTHVIALLIPVYLTSYFAVSRRLDNFLLHAAWMTSQVVLYQVILFCIYGFVGQVAVSKTHWLAPLSALLFLPLGHHMLVSRFARGKGVV